MQNTHTNPPTHLQPQPHDPAPAADPTPPPRQFGARVLHFLRPVEQPDGTVELESYIPDDVQRSLDGVPALLERAKLLLANERPTDPCSRITVELRQFAADFYGTYTVGSGVLTNAFGPELVLHTFWFLAPLYFRLGEDEDLDGWERLPEEFEVYRAGWGPAEDLARGLSWTRSPKVAECYRLNTLNTQPPVEPPPDVMVISARVRREHLLAYFTMEQECIMQTSRLEGWKVEVSCPTRMVSSPK